MDFSMIGYTLLIPSILFALSGYWNGKISRISLFIYHIIILLLFTIIIVADLELYRSWGFRIDGTPLLYLTKPKEAAGSTSIFTYIFLIFLIFVLYSFFIAFFKSFIYNKLIKLKKEYYLNFFLFILIGALLIIPIRGSFGIAPMNVGFAYFHKSKAYANHAATNAIWNFFYSLKSLDKVKPHNFVNKQVAAHEFYKLQNNSDSTIKILKSTKPNVIIIMLESFTAKLINRKVNNIEITPQINKLIKEGIYFPEFYSSGDRTDKGIVSILSGYPAQPKTSIIKFPNKTQKLPYLTKDVKKIGYRSAFIYGGDVDFANMRSYINNAEFEQVITMNDFPKSTYNSKWGVHDNFVFERLFSEINKSKTPFFYFAMTLSSHEPFEVPMKQILILNSEENKFLNAAHFTDKCVGDFVAKAKLSNWWSNTLLVFVADHGHRLPDNSQMADKEKYKIVSFWLGGALNKTDTVVQSIANQTDIAATILNQININSKQYKFSRNIFTSHYQPFSFVDYNNGFGIFNNKNTIFYDLNSNQSIVNKGDSSNFWLKTGKIYLQVLTDDFIAR